MDKNAVMRFMAAEKNAPPVRQRSREDRDRLAQIKAAPHLDQTNADVTVVDGRIEQWHGIADHQFSASGALIITWQGEDSDGDLVTNRSIVYASGQWLVVELDIEPVPNPYYVDPSEVANGGE